MLSFVLVIAPLIFVHELGHYFVARWFGIKADTFSIGFGREIAGWTDRRGTRWKVGWLPIGGYVKFAGDMNAASQPSSDWLTMPAEERARMFAAKPVWQRFLVVAAGPVTNFIFAIAILIGFILAFGEPRTPPLVASVQHGSAAEAAGLRAGDTITRIGGVRIDRFEDIARQVVLRPGEPLKVEGTRLGRAFSVVARPRPDVQRDTFGNQYTRGLLGIGGSGVTMVKVSPAGALSGSVRMTWDMVAMTVEGVGQMIRGTRSVSELGGPLKIAKLSGEQASLGPVAYFWLLAVFSINLGFINLLPVPMLDGGHLLFYAIEAVRRRPLKPEAQEWAFRTGLAALLALMIFVTINDLASFGLWSKLGGLIGWA